MHKHHVGNQVAVVLNHELLLPRGKFLIKINNDEIHLVFVLVVETDGAASLPLGIESTLFKHEDVVNLAFHQAGAICPGDERAILAVSVVVEVRIQLQLLGGQGCSQQENHDNKVFHQQ